MRPRYELAKQTGRRFFEEYVNTPCCDLVQLVNKMGWTLLTCDLKGEEGYTFHNVNTNEYQINMKNGGSPRRNKFTLAHEIGHIVMDHYTTFDINNITKEEYKMLDEEANAVAGEILMPYKYILNWHDYSQSQLIMLFEVSKSALETRLSFLEHELSLERSGA